MGALLTKGNEQNDAVRLGLLRELLALLVVALVGTKDGIHPGEGGRERTLQRRAVVVVMVLGT